MDHFTHHIEINDKRRRWRRPFLDAALHRWLLGLKVVRRAAHVNRSHFRGERYCFPGWETVRTVPRSAGACYVELDDNGKARGQLKVCRGVREPCKDAAASPGSVASLAGSASTGRGSGIGDRSAVARAGFVERWRHSRAKTCTASKPGSTASKSNVGSTWTGRGGVIGGSSATARATPSTRSTASWARVARTGSGAGGGGGSATACAASGEPVRNGHLKDRHMLIQTLGHLPDITIPPTYKR